MSACTHWPFANKKSLSETKAVLQEPAEFEFDPPGGQDGKPFRFRQDEDLKASASGGLSAAGAKYIAKISPVVSLIDLRQEAHGLVNDLSISWVAAKNWGFVGLNSDEMLNREKRYLSKLHIGGKIKGKRIRSVETEESLVRSLGINYIRLNVTDHLRPSDAEVDRFIEALKDIPRGSWIHFQDRDGRVRASSFLLMYQFLRSAPDADFASLVKRHTGAEDFDVFKVFAEGEWETPYQRDLAEFLRAFYEYARTDPLQSGLSWSDWIRK